jgi:serine phosphatase RsbU (regulator of sigma subunit)/CHASE1-domain containing sensor protein
VRARRRSAGTLALFALVVLGLAATVLAVQAAFAASDDRERQAATLAAARLSGALEQAVGSVRGADALVADGVVDADEFRLFARGVVRSSVYTALAYAEVVEQADRDAFVERTGIEITDTDGAGGFVPAEPRPRSVVVTEAYPRTASTSSIIGFDIAGEPVRQRATVRADASLTPVLSDRTRTAASGLIGVSVMHAVRTSDGSVVGYLTSGLSVRDSMERAGVPASPDDQVGLWMDGEQMTETAPAQGAEREFMVAGRTFVVRVDSPRDLGLLLPVLIGTGTLVLAAVVAIAARRDQRQREALDRIARRNAGIAEFGGLLAAAPDTDSVADVLGSAAGPVLDDAECLVVRRSAERRGVLSPDRSRLRPEISEWLVAGPVSRCMETGDVVAAPSASVATDVHGVGSYLCVPMSFSGGFTAAALAFVWPDETAPALMDERSVAARTVAELAGPALERALVAEFVRTGAERLSAFARLLAAAATTDDVAAAVSDFVPLILGAQSAELTLGAHATQLDDTTSGTSVEQTVAGPDAEPVGVLSVRWRRDTVVGSTQHSVLVTLGDLVEQTLGRTMRSQQQLDVISQLQRELLAEPPIIPGLDVAVGYQPALSVVGLGGDFYDVVVSDGGLVFAVIGDITGHGPRAVAVMSELKSVIHQLLRSETDLVDVIAQADQLLDRRDVLATAQVFEFDLAARTVRYVNAGHPYPVLRRTDGSVGLLRDGHRALLGLTDHASIVTRPAVTTFEEGDTLLLYTDGLIERRDTNLDSAIQALAERLTAVDDRSMADLVERLEHEMARRGTRVDDDIALLALRRLPPIRGSGRQE